MRPLLWWISIFAFVLSSPTMLHAETWRGLIVAPEDRCAPYRASQYSYTQTLEKKIVDAYGGAVYGPYTDTCFDSTRETDIEHIVARSEAHDSGLCAKSNDIKRAFARDLLSVTLASPHVNRNLKRDKDATEWLPPQNRCWFANRVVEIKRKYGMTVDPAERDALQSVLAECESTAMSAILCPNSFIPHIAQGEGWETRLTFINGCARSETFRVNLMGPDGRAQQFRVEGVNVLQESIRSDQSRTIVFANSSGGLIQGYGHIVENGQGCIAVEVEYRQHFRSGDTLFATVPRQPMNTQGTILTSAPPGCSTGMAIAAGGGRVRLEAYDAQGHLRGSADLGHVYHDAFGVNSKIPSMDMLDAGHVRIIGKATVLGLDFCDGELAQFRLGHPLRP